MFAVHKIYDVKDKPVLAPKIAFYVIYDLNLSRTDKCSVMINISCSISNDKMLMVQKIYYFTSIPSRSKPDVTWLKY